MTPEKMAEIHARAFSHSNSWPARDFKNFYNDPFTHIITHYNGFAVIKGIPPELEILTLAVDPKHQGKKIAYHLLNKIVEKAKSMNITHINLEVSQNNKRAISLYTWMGYEIIGKRLKYYSSIDGKQYDALLMQYNVL